MDRESLLQSIVGMLEGMDEEQLKNCYDYVTDESSEKNHEDHALQILKGIIEENTRLQLKLEGKLKE